MFRGRGQHKSITITIFPFSSGEGTSITVGTDKVKFMRLKPFSGFMAYLYKCFLWHKKEENSKFCEKVEIYNDQYDVKQSLSFLLEALSHEEEYLMSVG